MFGWSIDGFACCKHKYLHNSIPILLMFGDEVSEAHEDNLIEFLVLAVHLWIICCCFQAFNTDKGANSGKEFADKLSTIICKDVR